MSDAIERALEVIRAWEKYREGIEFELEQVKRRAKMLRADIEHADQQIRKAIKCDESQQLLDGMDDVGYPPDRASWRDAPLEVVVGKGPILDKLKAKSIETLGQLADYREGGWSLITGCGLTEHQEHVVQEACNTYWGTHDADA